MNASSFMFTLNGLSYQESIYTRNGNVHVQGQDMHGTRILTVESIY